MYAMKKLQLKFFSMWNYSDSNLKGFWVKIISNVKETKLQFYGPTELNKDAILKNVLST